MLPISSDRGLTPGGRRGVSRRGLTAGSPPRPPQDRSHSSTPSPGACSAQIPPHLALGSRQPAAAGSRLISILGGSQLGSPEEGRDGTPPPGRCLDASDSSHRGIGARPTPWRIRR